MMRKSSPLLSLQMRLQQAQGDLEQAERIEEQLLKIERLATSGHEPGAEERLLANLIDRIGQLALRRDSLDRELSNALPRIGTQAHRMIAPDMQCGTSDDLNVWRPAPRSVQAATELATRQKRRRPSARRTSA